MSNQYSVKYFIKRFEAIPEEKWMVCLLSNGLGQFCAMGHLGVQNKGGRYAYTEEANALNELMGMNEATTLPNISEINDGFRDYVEKFGDTPKARVVNALLCKLRTAASVK